VTAPTRSISHPLEALRLRFLERSASLLESLVRSQQFGIATRRIIRLERDDVLADLQQVQSSSADAAITATLDDIVLRSTSLRDTIEILSHERERGWQENTQSILGIMRDFDEMTATLSATLIDKSLFERQGRVLENIILSYERVSHWQTFVQEILTDFHGVFPFDFFIVTFSEEHSLLIHIFFMGDYPAHSRQAVRDRFIAQFLECLHLPSTTPVDVEEFITLRRETTLEVEDVTLLSVTMPEHIPRLAGLLGVGYASTVALTSQERGIIRSILSVMMMVVGSSKVLSRTLTELEYYSTHDPLTGLYNRRHFNEIVEYEIGRSERHVHEFALLFLDMDDFKEINDSYGHPVGDEVLRTLSGRIANQLRKGDIACRIGGDELALLLPETSREGGMVAAEQIRQLIHEEKFRTPDGRIFYASVSVGVVSYPRDALTIDELMANVDVSLYQAKRQGKNTTANIDSVPGLLQSTRDVRARVEELRQALAEDRLFPYFQPIIHCKTREIFAYECVARLITADGTIVSAAAFIEHMERYGLAEELDRRIIEKALIETRRYLDAGGVPKLVFINLSAQEIQGGDIIDHALRLCNELAIPTQTLVFEVLERDAIGDMSHMRAFLADLRKKGFAFALDDFGSGYNSFHYLRELHFEYVKLDGAFVRNILDSTIDYALVRSLIRLCADIGIQTVAEFIENEEILVALQTLGADFGQGYHTGMPAPRMLE
jgi:diguanylate cyclase (GGDEF)-like protein